MAKDPPKKIDLSDSIKNVVLKIDDLDSNSGWHVQAQELKPGGMVGGVVYGNPTRKSTVGHNIPVGSIDPTVPFELNGTPMIVTDVEVSVSTIPHIKTFCGTVVKFKNEDVVEWCDLAWCLVSVKWENEVAGSLSLIMEWSAAQTWADYSKNQSAKRTKQASSNVKRVRMPGTVIWPDSEEKDGEASEAEAAGKDAAPTECPHGQSSPVWCDACKAGGQRKRRARKRR
jgi:hypothetical protein